jgi:hypothetical protein
MRIRNAFCVLCLLGSSLGVLAKDNSITDRISELDLIGASSLFLSTYHPSLSSTPAFLNLCQCPL